MGVFDFFRRKPVVEQPTVEQNVLVEDANEEKPVNNKRFCVNLGANCRALYFCI